jgi:DNA-binding transcriptional LysR family regulator
MATLLGERSARLTRGNTANDRTLGTVHQHSFDVAGRRRPAVENRIMSGAKLWTAIGMAIPASPTAAAGEIVYESPGSRRTGSSECLRAPRFRTNHPPRIIVELAAAALGIAFLPQMIAEQMQAFFPSAVSCSQI